MNAVKEYREKLAGLARETMKVMADVNETEKTVSRIKNELQEMYEKVDESLDKETKPIIP